MPYRGDETDPLEIIIAQRRAMRRALLFGLAWMILPAVWRFDYQRWAAVLLLLASPPAAAPAAAVNQEPLPKEITAKEVERLLGKAVASSGTPKDRACLSGHNGWQYVCSYRSGPDMRAPWLKIGLVVGPNGIVHASGPYPIDRRLPEAPRAGPSR